MDAGEISKAVESSSNLILEIIDRFFPFCGLTKKALEVYIAEIEKTDKPKEFKAWEIMKAKKEFRQLKNINSVVEFAKDYCTEEDIKKVSYKDNEEWYDNFFERASTVSDESVQRIWGQILANEIKEKGVTPRSVINVLTEIDSQLAKAFATLCSQRLIFVPLDENGTNINRIFFNEVIIMNNNKYYENKGLGLVVLNELEAIGLISTNSLGYLKRVSSAKKFLISDGVFTDCVIAKEGEIQYGNVMLTRAGKYILEIINPGYAHDQHEIMRDYYTENGYKFEDTNKNVEIIDGRHIKIHEQ